MAEGAVFPVQTLGRRWLVSVELKAAARSEQQRTLGGELSADLKEVVHSGQPKAVELLQRMLHAAVGSGRFALRESGSPGSEPFLRQLFADFEREIDDGRLRVTLEERHAGSPVRRETPVAPASPPPPKESTDTFFDVRYMDETGQALNGLPVVINAGGDEHQVKTNAAGVALLEGVYASSAFVSIASVVSLETILDKRWVKPRPGAAPKVSNSISVPFEGRAVPGLSLKPAVPHAVIITPPLGKLFVELWEKTGKFRHANRKYTIDGPQSFSGTTDAKGRLEHDGVFPGDYTLKFDVEAFDGKDKTKDSYESPIVVLAANSGTPELRRLGAIPRTVLLTLRFFFNTNKTFLLPTALQGVRELTDLYVKNDPSKLLVVGHASDSGDAAADEKLSLDRAKAMIAYLKDDVDAWLAFYESSVPKRNRWGTAEDHMMIRSMPGFANKPRGEDAVRWYQRTRKLKVDGDAGPETRKKLVTEYMALDGTSLEELGVAVAAVAHGCGSNFPLPGPDAKGGAPAEGEPPAKEQKNPQSGRRVELFFFDTEFGMVPAPPSDTSKAGSQEYEAWQKSVVETHALEAGGDGAKLVFIEFGDTLFRTNSAVVLPDGEAPGAAPGAAERVAAASVVANVIRYNERQRGKKRVVVAGHTDTEGEASVNKPLSEERAKCVLAVVTGDREEFKNLCDARHKVSDYKQVLAWASSSLEGLTFDCHPGAIDDDAATGKPAVERFQRAYNRNKSALGSSEADLGVDGKVGKLTWGAFFDCYEFALRKKLGVDAAGMKDLRKRLTFADDDHKAIGFGEYFPVEEQGVDDRESQVNRRAEVIFLDPEEIPDLEHAAEDPETSELYLPGGFVHVPVAGALRSTEFNVRLRTPDDEPIAGELYALSAGGEVLDTNVTGLDGGIRFSLEPGTTEVQVELPNLERTLTFAVGGLASMSEGDGIAGAQGRLMNLGFGVPSVTGSIDPDTEAALRDFQREGKLTESGQLDGPTKAELVRRYGS